MNIKTILASILSASFAFSTAQAENKPGVYGYDADSSCKTWTDDQNGPRGTIVKSWILGFATGSDTMMHLASPTNKLIYSSVKNTHDIINPAFAWCLHNPSEPTDKAALAMVAYLLQSGNKEKQNEIINPEWIKEASTYKPETNPKNTSQDSNTVENNTSSNPDTGNLESIFHPNMTGEEIQLAPYDAQGTNNVCTAQWTKAGKEDREMIALCISEKKNAYRGLTRFLTKFHGFPWMHSTFDAIAQKWTKYGVPDYEMIMHELDSDQESYKDLKYFYDTKKADSDQLSSALEQAQNMSGYLDFEMADFNYKESANVPH